MALNSKLKKFLDLSLLGFRDLAGFVEEFLQKRIINLSLFNPMPNIYCRLLNRKNGNPDFVYNLSPGLILFSLGHSHKHQEA